MDITGREACTEASEPEAEDAVGDSSAVPSRNRPRRKATEKPNGADALRQSFSKRKKGLAAKAYQLHRLTDARVALFVVNDKGSSWAYSTPGFGAAVSPTYLSLMRKLAGLSSSQKLSTEVIPHPCDESARDDRQHWEERVHPAFLDLQVHALGGGMVTTVLHPGFAPSGQLMGQVSSTAQSLAHIQQSPRMLDLAQPVSGSLQMAPAHQPAVLAQQSYLPLLHAEPAQAVIASAAPIPDTRQCDSGAPPAKQARTIPAAYPGGSPVPAMLHGMGAAHFQAPHPAACGSARGHTISDAGDPGTSNPS
uniref:Transcription factor-like protein n=1 Tax=Tetraselmis sp. GSL018 TaxID=582737 RepID=A0A061RI69_9CHLO|mmetsp:Transcript_41461/g.98236  ORF Transcript_41461/g.98236 Transcript_41461/m.98236 type:complete len:307 (-) Transcript_41461:283-1203(-)